MRLQYFLFVVVVSIGATNACPRKCAHRPCSIHRQPACISNYNMVTHYPAVIESIGCCRSCQKPRCNDQLILPPLAPELPCGLGYLPGALPLVANYFQPGINDMITGAYIPVSRGCDCLTLAAPISPDLAPLVKPIIL